MDTCAADSGICGHAAGPQGVACDDGSKCSAGDQCAGGKCVGIHGEVALQAGISKAGQADGPGPAASFNGPTGMVFDPKGQLFIADTDNNRIRLLTNWGQVLRIAGFTKGFADGHFNSARFSAPRDLAVGPDGTLVIVDTGNSRIRRFRYGWEDQVSTVAGDAKAGFADGIGANALFNAPGGIVADGSGRFFVADTGNNRVRVIAPGWKVSTLAGSGVSGADDGPGGQASFKAPAGIDLDSKGFLWLADSGNGRIRRISTKDGSTATVAGGAADPGSGPAPLVPMDIAVGADGWLYIADTGHNGLLRMSEAGHRAVLSKSALQGGADGALWLALWDTPAAVAVASDGAVWLSESGGHRIRRVAAVASVCGDGKGCTGDHCDPKTGDCAWGAVVQQSCDDGDASTSDWCDKATGSCAHK